jgi:hypothetical protein
MKFYYLLSILLFLTIMSCSKDEPTEDLLRGTINNMAFETGQSTYSELDDDLQFNIFSNDFTSNDPCVDLPGGVRIFFKAKSTLEKQDLFLDSSSFEAFTVTIFDENLSLNLIITEGSFQISEIEDDLITAQLDIKADNTSIKGRFMASLCE